MSCKVYFRQLRASMWATDDDAQHIDAAATMATAFRVEEIGMYWTPDPAEFDECVIRYLHLRQAPWWNSRIGELVRMEEWIR